MVNSEDLREISNLLLCSTKGYTTENELKQTMLNWNEVLDEVTKIFLSLGLSVKYFNFKNERCYAIVGLPSDHDVYLNEKESFMILDFVIRFELLSPSSDGLEKKKWNELITAKVGNQRIFFTETLRKLKEKNLLEDNGSYVFPSWRYYVCIDKESLINDIKTDAKLSLFYQDELKERGIID